VLNDIYHSLDPIAFSVGPFQVHWYGLSYIVGFLLAALLIMHVAKRWHIKLSIDALLTVLIACMLGAILGGRIGYILIYGQGYYFEHPDQILAFSKGGMSFHGGLIGLAIGLIIAAKIIKMPMRSLGDLASIGTPVAIFLVRIANFVNGELWGAVTTLPWGVVFDATGGGALPRHPTQLYESILEGLVLLAILYFLARRRPPLPRGSYFGIFLIGYGVFRIAVEFVRQPDVQIGYLFNSGWITMGMMLSLPMVLVGLFFLIYSLARNAPQFGQEWKLTADDDTDASDNTNTDADADVKATGGDNTSTNASVDALTADEASDSPADDVE
jgi:phosphatidylglycerol:prolipoprotein diacylglycerol transferase